MLATEKTDRLNAGINHLIFYWVHAHRADIAVEHLFPGLAAVARTIEAIVSHTDKDFFRRLPAAVDRVDNTALEMARDLLPSAACRPPTNQSMLRVSVTTESFAAPHVVCSSRTNR